MLRLLPLLLLLQAFIVVTANAREPGLELVVTAPYLEMHTGDVYKRQPH